MRKLLVTTFTVIAASGCAASTAPTDQPDDEPPPSSTKPMPHVADAATASDGWTVTVPPAVEPKQDPGDFLWQPPPPPPVFDAVSDDGAVDDTREANR